MKQQLFRNCTITAVISFLLLSFTLVVNATEITKVNNFPLSKFGVDYLKIAGGDLRKAKIFSEGEREIVLNPKVKPKRLERTVKIYTLELEEVFDNDGRYMNATEYFFKRNTPNTYLSLLDMEGDLKTIAALNKSIAAENEKQAVYRKKSAEYRKVRRKMEKLSNEFDKLADKLGSLPIKKEKKEQP